MGLEYCTKKSIIRYNTSYVLYAVAIALLVIIQTIRAGSIFYPVAEWKKNMREINIELIQTLVTCNISRWANKAETEMQNEGVGTESRILPKRIIVLDKASDEFGYYDPDSDTLFIYAIPYYELNKIFAYVWMVIWDYTFPQIRNQFIEIAPKERSAISKLLAEKFLKFTSISKRDLEIVRPNWDSIDDIALKLVQNLNNFRILNCFIHLLSTLNKEDEELTDKINQIISIMESRCKPRNKKIGNEDYNPNRVLFVNAISPERLEKHGKRYEDDAKNAFIKMIDAERENGVKTVFVISFKHTQVIQFGQKLTDHYKTKCKFRKSSIAADRTVVFVARLEF